MSAYVDSLLAARQALLDEAAAKTAEIREQLSELDGLLTKHGAAPASLPSLAEALTGQAPTKRRGRAASRKKATTKKAPAKKKGARKKAGRKKFNATAAVRTIVAETEGPFTIADLRAEFEKRHPGKLEKLNRIALSLAMQSLVRRGEAKAKKDPNSKGNLFSKTAKLKIEG